MNEKQIDLDSMRALATVVRTCNRNSLGLGTTIVCMTNEECVQFADGLDASLNEIEQLRKERHDMECDHPSSDGIAELTIFGEKIYRCGVCKRAHVYVRFGFDYTINLPERLIAALAAQGDKPHD